MDVPPVPPVPQQSLGGENPEASAPAEKGSDATVPTDMPGATPAPAVGMPLESLEVAPAPASTAADADTKDVPAVPPVPQQSLGGENPEFAAYAPPAVTVSSATETRNASIAAAVEKPVDEQIDTVAVEAVPLQAVKPEVEEIDEGTAVGVHQTFAALVPLDPSVVIPIDSDSEEEMAHDCFAAGKLVELRSFSVG